jgi:hypothetical protein
MESSSNLNAKKVILITDQKYSSEHDEMLNALIERKIELFCAVGKDCEKWEEALDWLCIGENGEEIGYVTTTSHPKESLEDVKAFAKEWKTEGSNDIEVINI